MISSYAGKELTVRVDRLGSIIVDLPSVDPHDKTSLEEEAQALLAPPTHMPPDAHPVKAGAEWNGAAPGITSRCRLRAVRDVHGKKLAEIEVREARAGREQTSVVLADVESGLV